MPGFGYWKTSSIVGEVEKYTVMRKTQLLCAFLLGVLPFLAMAQSNPNQLNGVSAKVLGIDYGTPNDVSGLDITYGLELAYLRRFSNYFGVALPLKIGVANVEGDTRNRNITSIDAILQVFPLGGDKKLTPYLLGGAGFVSENLEDGHIQMPLGLGFNYMMGENSYINVQGEYRIASEDLRDNLQLGLGYIYQFGRSDRDGDGIADGVDNCPDDFGPSATNGCPDRDDDGIADADDACPDEKGMAATNGCPDTDGDGWADNMDACPEVAGTIKGCPDRDGDGLADADDQCPEVAGAPEMDGCPDTDGDGLHDGIDNCPEEAGELTSKGCPANDRDNDGVADAEDQCPDEAGTAATRGCPDTDGDGVADKDDRCPEKAGPYTGCPDTDGDGVMDADDRCPEKAGLLTNKGCPEIEEEVQEVLNLAMRSVQFETGSSNLKSVSYGVLDQIAAIMDQYRAYELRISGHTDNVGEAMTNQILSEERARACLQYLASKGVRADRMSYAGYGEDQPIADNATSTGRSLNRRVEFELIIQ